MTTEFQISTPDAMMQLGAKFAGQAQAGNIFALAGTLGTGKTHWTKGFLNHLQPDTPVTSPTFSLVNEYRDAETPVYHFDFYRLKSEDELFALGWDEYIEESAIVICEWADLFPAIFPEHTQWLGFSHADDASRIVKRISKPDATVLE